MTETPSREDVAISAGVWALLHQTGQSVPDLAFHTRISVASLYRKLAGQACWKAGDISVVARHFSLQPGELFLGAAVTEADRR